MGAAKVVIAGVVMLFMASNATAGEAEEELARLAGRLEWAVAAHAQGSTTSATDAFVDVDAGLSLLRIRYGRPPASIRGYDRLVRRARGALPRFVVEWPQMLEKFEDDWQADGPWACGVGTYAMLLELAGSGDEACRMLVWNQYCCCDACGVYRCDRIRSAILLRKGEYAAALDAMSRQQYLWCMGVDRDRDDIYFLNRAFLLEKLGRMSEAVDAYRRTVDLAPGTEAAALAKTRLVLMKRYEAPTLGRVITYLDDNSLKGAALLALSVHEFEGSFDAIVGAYNVMFVDVCRRAVARYANERSTAVLEAWDAESAFPR